MTGRRPQPAAAPSPPGPPSADPDAAPAPTTGFYVLHAPGVEGQPDRWAVGYMDAAARLARHTRRDGRQVYRITATADAPEPLERLVDVLGVGSVRRTPSGAARLTIEGRHAVRTALRPLLPYLQAQRAAAEMMLSACDAADVPACAVSGCARPHAARHLCVTHYRRAQRQGFLSAFDGNGCHVCGRAVASGLADAAGAICTTCHGALDDRVPAKPGTLG
jgi:hypothetical protein